MNPRAKWLETICTILGWSYFTVWTISFYPQVITNYKTKSTIGLSYEFVIYNLFGFMALACFDIIRFCTQRDYDLAKAVAVEDLAFAVHSVALCAAGLFQILYYNYDHLKRTLTWKCALVVSIIICVVVIHIVLWRVGSIPLTPVPQNDEGNHLQQKWCFTDSLVWIKMMVTLFKYIPQIVLNCNRKSTHGLAIWQFTLDLMGGILSLLQMLLQSINFKTVSYVTDNVPKFGIGIVTLGYDGVILAQKYCIYPRQESDTETKEQLSPLARKESSYSRLDSELQSLKKGGT